MFHSISKVDIHATAIRAAQGVGASIRYQAAPDPAEVSPDRKTGGTMVVSNGGTHGDTPRNPAISWKIPMENMEDDWG